MSMKNMDWVYNDEVFVRGVSILILSDHENIIKKYSA